MRSDRRIAVRNADREGRGRCPVSRIYGAPAAPGDVIGREITRRFDVVIAQIPVAAIAAVVAASDRVFRILEPVTFNQCVTFLTHVNTGTGNSVVEVVVHMRPTATLQRQTR